MDKAKNGAEHEPRTRVVLEAIAAEKITVYYVDAYSSATANDAGEMRGCSTVGLTVVDRLIASGWARVSVTRRPVLNREASTADAVATVLLTALGRAALARARSAEGSEKQRAYTLLARLEMVSHGTTQSFNAGARGGEVVRLFPPGGVAFKDDRDDPALKSHVYFRRRLQACRSEGDYAALADEVESVLARWRRSSRPPRDSAAWREAVATDTRRASVVAEEWGISRSYVHQIRQAHRRRQQAA